MFRFPLKADQNSNILNASNGAHHDAYPLDLQAPGLLCDNQVVKQTAGRQPKE